MKQLAFFLVQFCFFSLFSAAQDFKCISPPLSSFSGPWSESDAFLTLNFEGPLAARLFQGMGEADSNFSVILHKDWCKSLKDTVLCETPSSALVDVESFTVPNGPKKVNSLRYFLAILNYREDGWAFLKVRGKRLDELPPLNLNTEFPVGSCAISEE